MKKLLMIFLPVILPLSLCAKTWYVSDSSGNDGYSGAKNQPFKTISKGAEMAQIGDTVYVFAGTYRERVSPPRGGVVYFGEPGKRVFIKGSDIYEDQWSFLSEGTYAADLNKMQFTDDCYWDNANPFKVGSSVTPYNRNIAKNVPGNGYTLGQVFVEGEMYIQCPYQRELPDVEGCWWYDPYMNYVLVHFKNGHSMSSKVEITTRRRILAPHIKGLHNIHVIGFKNR
jgi:hypothetical protein